MILLQQNVHHIFGRVEGYHEYGKELQYSASLSTVGLYRVFSAQADSTLIHTSHKDREQSTTEASITLDDTD
jgi:hypothetical protein